MFRKIGDCGLPIDIGPFLASQLFACRNVFADLRIATHIWVLVSNDPASTEYFVVASRNVTRARASLSLGKYRRPMGAGDLPRDAEGNVVDEPPGGEMLLPVSGDILPSQTPIAIFGPTWNTFGNPATPRREPQYAPPTAPDPEVARMEGASRAKDDVGLTQRYAASPSASQLIAVSQEQLKRAGLAPTRGWQTRSVLYLDGNPADVAFGLVFVSKDFRNLDVDRGQYWANQWAHLPLPSKPLKLSGLIRRTSAPHARMQVCFVLSLAGDSKFGGCKNGSRGMEMFPTIGPRECARGPTHRGRTLNEFLIWAPPTRGFAARASGKSWRCFEAREKRDIRPAWRPIPSWAFR